MNQYIKAMVILEKLQPEDYEKLVWELARLSPTRFCRAAEAIGISGSKITADCRKLMLDGETVKAIKLYRENTGASLIDAKNFVEGLI